MAAEIKTNTSFNDLTQKQIKETMELLVSGPAQLKLRSAALSGMRTLYFKGKHASNALLRYNHNRSPEKKFLNITTREEALKVLNECLKTTLYFVPVNKIDKNKIVRVYYNPEKDVFNEETFYMLIYEGSKLKAYLQGTGILVSIFSLAVIQIWPEKPRKIVYFVVLFIISLLIALLIISIIRLLVNIFCKAVLGLDLWILPNLYEDVSFKENFIPMVKIYKSDVLLTDGDNGHEDGDVAG